MALFSLSLPPGCYRNGTNYQSKGRWFVTQLVRFLEGMILPVGGWTALEKTDGDVTLSGVPRAAVGWRGNDGSAWMAFGTNTNLYAYSSGSLIDITPATAAVLDAGGVSAAPSEGGYGSGSYGLGSYGVTVPSTTFVQPGTWTLDTFGDYLVGVLHPSDGRLWIWDRVPANEAVQVTDTTYAANTPTQNRAVVVTPERFLMVLGTYDTALAGPNVRRVKWADQEGYTDWTSQVTNTAGDFDLETNGALVAGARARGETLLWTDVDLHAAHYVGGTLVYAFKKLGSNCGLIAPNAKALFEGGAAWMSEQGFFVYDGFVKQLHCEVFDYVFDDLNMVQKAKCWAMPNSRFGEIWWFYPSAQSDEIDRYVIWNYREDHWAIGELDRTAGFDRGAFDTPIMAASTGAVYEHESGDTRGGELASAATGPMELGEGERVMSVQYMYPDEKSAGDVTGQIISSFYPNGTETTSASFNMANPTSLRVTGRQMRLVLTSTADGTDWRVGLPRFTVVPGGVR